MSAPVNALAAAHYADGQGMSEREYVASLYKLRALTIQQHVLLKLNATKPDDAYREPLAGSDAHAER